MKLGIEGWLRSGTQWLAAAALVVVFLPWLGFGMETSSLKVIDKKGRELEVVVLEVTEGQVKMRRVSDQREFSIPMSSLSEASQEQIGKAIKEASEKAAEVSISEVEIPDQAMAHIQKRWAVLKGSLSKDVDPTKLQVANAQLIEVLALEKDLVIAGSPKDPATPVDWPEDLDQRTVEKVKELRQSIRDGERGNLFIRMGAQVEGTKPRAIVSDKERLNSLYDSSLKPLKQALAKAQKALAKGSTSKLQAERFTKELESEVDRLEAAISRMRDCFYGLQGEEWWSVVPNWPEDHPAEVLRREISDARKKYHETLVKAANHEGEDGYQMAEIDGVSFYSANFGVILDISGSMTPHIPALKEDINKNFQSPLYREVVGCALRVVEMDGRLQATGRNDTISSVEEMLLIYKVDTIYWFCDLRDERTEDALHHLGELMRKSGARLYVRSVGRGPDRDLKKLIHDF